jgi:urea transporter
MRSPAFAWRIAIPMAVQSQLSGIGQIYFQSSPIFGTALLLCLYLSAPALALGGLLGVCVASATAWMLDFPEADRRKGIYSFNAALSGVGLCASYQLSATLAAWIALAGVLSAVFSRVAQYLNIPAFTSMFVGVMWLSIAAAPSIGLQAMPLDAAGACSLASPGFLFCGVGQVCFVGAAPLGLLVVSALSLKDWQLGVWALGGALLAWLVLAMADSFWPSTGMSAQSTAMAVNSALAMLATYVLGRAWKWRVVAAALSIVVCAVMSVFSLPYFTFPFVCASWAVLWLTRKEHASPP